MQEGESTAWTGDYNLQDGMCLRNLLQVIKNKKLEGVLIKLGKQEVIHRPKKCCGRKEREESGRGHDG